MACRAASTKVEDGATITSTFLRTRSAASSEALLRTNWLAVVRVAAALGKEIVRQGRAPLLFVEVNTGEEPQKGGVLPAEVGGFLAACRDRYGLTIAGLMCIPPIDEPPAPHFALTAKIARRNGLSLLSMGMSADFATAIALGATHVRIGTAIFGTRG